MIDSKELLELTKEIVGKAALQFLNQTAIDSLKKYNFDPNLRNEIKALADTVLEEDILSSLKPLGIPILSEESGYVKSSDESEYLFIVDPLDGTFNFVKNFGGSAISVALWHQEKPVFGVIFNLDKRELYWGGEGQGAFCDGKKIKISNTSVLKDSLICTGFPVRYNLNNLMKDNFMDVLREFAKVRMIGSAAISIVNVAKGISDAYFEKNIMLWDVAAGLAIAEGAGGKYILISSGIEHSFDVFVSNGELLTKIKNIIDEH